MKNLVSLCRQSLDGKSEKMHLSIVKSIRELDRQLWDQVVGEDQVYLGAEYLLSLEEQKSIDIDYRYAVASSGGTYQAVAYFQIVNIGGNTLRFSEDKPKEDRCHYVMITDKVKNLIKGAINKIEFKLLLCGSAFVTGQYGFQYMDQLQEEDAHNWLADVIDEIKKRDRIEAIMFRDFGIDKPEKMQRLLGAKYKPVNMQPNMVLPLHPAWSSFNDYINSITSKYRVRARKVYEKSASLSFETLGMEQIKKHKTELYNLYQFVADRAEYNMAYVNDDYFVSVKEHLGEDFEIIGAWQEGELVGFISSLRGKEVLHGHFIGYNEEFNKNYKVYHRLLFVLIERGIDLGLQKVEFGRTATEIKSTLGARGKAMYSYVWHSNPVTNSLLKPLFKAFNYDEWTLRNPFKKEYLAFYEL